MTVNTIVIRMYHEGEWKFVIGLTDVTKRIPDLIEALTTLSEWLPYDWEVTIEIYSKRKEASYRDTDITHPGDHNDCDSLHSL